MLGSTYQVGQRRPQATILEGLAGRSVNERREDQHGGQMFPSERNANGSKLHSETLCFHVVLDARTHLGSPTEHQVQESAATALASGPEDDGLRVANRNLTKREKEVLAKVLLGFSNKVIAYDLGIAHATVRVLLHRAMVKFGVRKREALLARLHAAMADDFHQQLEAGHLSGPASMEQATLSNTSVSCSEKRTDVTGHRLEPLAEEA
jgi:DNA-binding CsgD family transcriptional regulator